MYNSCHSIQTAQASAAHSIVLNIKEVQSVSEEWRERDTQEGQFLFIHRNPAGLKELTLAHEVCAKMDSWLTTPGLVKYRIFLRSTCS